MEVVGIRFEDYGNRMNKIPESSREEKKVLGFVIQTTVLAESKSTFRASKTKSWVQTQDLRYQAVRTDSCATRPVESKSQQESANEQIHQIFKVRHDVKDVRI